MQKNSAQWDLKSAFSLLMILALVSRPAFVKMKTGMDFKSADDSLSL